jgi:hypothetical protein
VRTASLYLIVSAVLVLLDVVALQAASLALGAGFSGVQRVSGGHPHTRPRASQPTHLLFGPSGPPLSPQVASATEVAATSDTRGAITIRWRLLMRGQEVEDDTQHSPTLAEE